MSFIVFGNLNWNVQKMKLDMKIIRMIFGKNLFVFMRKLFGGNMYNFFLVLFLLFYLVIML